MRAQLPVRTRRAALAVSALPVLAACAPAGFDTSVPTSVAANDSGPRIQPVVPSTDLAVGPNRLALGVLQQVKGETTPLVDADLKLRFFYPIEPQAVQRSEVTPQFRYVDDKRKGLYIATVEFDKAGIWGLEVVGTAAGSAIGPARIQFPVKPKPDTPAIGTPAPRSRSLTRFDVDDIKKIDSGLQPNDMHDLSIAQAIEQHKPLVIAFASPGFCVTQTCAPEVGEVQKLKAKYGSQASFIHIEIYKDPMTRTPYETVKEWGLTTEPWVFMVDRDGQVAAKFEGPSTLSELEPALQKLL